MPVTSGKPVPRVSSGVVSRQLLVDVRLGAGVALCVRLGPLLAQTRSAVTTALRLTS